MTGAEGHATDAQHNALGQNSSTLLGCLLTGIHNPSYLGILSGDAGAASRSSAVSNL